MSPLTDVRTVLSRIVTSSTNEIDRLTNHRCNRVPLGPNNAPPTCHSSEECVESSRSFRRVAPGGASPRRRADVTSAEGA